MRFFRSERLSQRKGLGVVVDSKQHEKGAGGDGS